MLNKAPATKASTPKSENISSLHSTFNSLYGIYLLDRRRRDQHGLYAALSNSEASCGFLLWWRKPNLASVTASLFHSFLWIAKETLLTLCAALQRTEAQIERHLS
ncbi:MAG: hypothetical protein NZ952_04000 [Candidatus Bathyarchaeota archaeon]|nr:hypothetical protein [Candidatus Bathyarchaeota archaeon]